jgi:hypothetical protein
MNKAHGNRLMGLLHAVGDGCTVLDSEQEDAPRGAVVANSAGCPKREMTLDRGSIRCIKAESIRRGRVAPSASPRVRRSSSKNAYPRPLAKARIARAPRRGKLLRRETISELSHRLKSVGNGWRRPLSKSVGERLNKPPGRRMIDPPGGRAGASNNLGPSRMNP